MKKKLNILQEYFRNIEINRIKYNTTINHVICKPVKKNPCRT